jgi:hypothetical protein
MRLAPEELRAERMPDLGQQRERATRGSNSKGPERASLPDRPEVGPLTRRADPIRRALSHGGALTVTIVLIILSTSPRVGRPDDIVRYERVLIITYA